MSDDLTPEGFLLTVRIIIGMLSLIAGILMVWSLFTIQFYYGEGISNLLNRTFYMVIMVTSIGVGLVCILPPLILELLYLRELKRERKR